MTAPRSQLYLKTQPTLNIGIFSPDQKAAILRERPDVSFITLESIHPLRISLTTADARTIDLTPLIPTSFFNRKSPFAPR